MNQEEPSHAFEGPGMDAMTARRRRGVEFRAMLLLLLLALILVGSALYLMWARGAFEQTQPLYLMTDDSDGVLVGMDLTFSGFPIGRVRRIDLVRSGEVRIHVDVPVKDAHWLRTSSVFTLERGLVGAARLRAFTGVPDDPPLPPEVERMVLRGDVSAEIPKMVSDAREVLQNVSRLTARESALQRTLRSVESVAGRMATGEGGLVAALTGDAADARRASQLLQQANALLQHLDAVVQRANTRLLGTGGLASDAQGAVRELEALLQELRRSTEKVDAILQDVQVVAGNVRAASTDLDDLRGDVDSSLRKLDGLVTELNRRWPFAPREKEVPLP